MEAISKGVDQVQDSSSSSRSEGLLVSSDEDSKNGWTKKQILTAITLSLMYLAQAISFGIISPFYPSEAAKKGASSVVVGLVFGVFELVIFITSPIYGSFIQEIGARYMFLSGSFLLGGCSLAFGFLDRCPDGVIYIVMCFICRTVEANGCAMLATASFAIMASTFPDNVGKAIGILEIFGGLGMVIGPAVGGVLYEVGGFLVPFAVMGGVVWLATIISFFILPKIEAVPKVSGSILSLFKIPGCVIVYIIISCCGASLSYLDPTFSPFIQKNFPWVTIEQIGFLCMVGPGVYALTAPVSGYICDKGYLGSLVVGGLFLTAIAFFLLGPNPLLSAIIPNTVVEIIIADIILGLAVGSVIIPVFPIIINLARYHGFEDNLQTYGLVSGFFNSSFSLGAFLGPTAAGYLAGEVGFAWSSSTCGFLNAALGLTMLIYVLTMRSQGKWPIPDPDESPEETTSINATSSNSKLYGSINA